MELDEAGLLDLPAEASVASLEEPTTSSDVSGGLRTLDRKRSCTVVCFALRLPLAFEILTGEPLMLIKALVLPTDFLRRTFNEPGFVSSDRGLEGDGESFLGGETRGCDRVGLKGLCVAPPRTKPLPLNGIIFLISCEPGSAKQWKKRCHLNNGA